MPFLIRALYFQGEQLLLTPTIDGASKRDDQQSKETLGDVHNVRYEQLTLVAGGRIAVLNDGRLEQIGTPTDVYERSENAFVAEFIGTSNVLEGAVRDGRLDLDIVELDGSFDGSGAVRAVVRPEAFDFGGPLETTVERVTYLGERTELLVRLSDDRTVTLRTEGSTSYSRGDTVSVGIDPASVRVLE